MAAESDIRRSRRDDARDDQAAEKPSLRRKACVVPLPFRSADASVGGEGSDRRVWGGGLKPTLRITEQSGAFHYDEAYR